MCIVVPFDGSERVLGQTFSGRKDFWIAFEPQTTPFGFLKFSDPVCDCGHASEDSQGFPAQLRECSHTY